MVAMKRKRVFDGINPPSPRLPISLKLRWTSLRTIRIFRRPSTWVVPKLIFDPCLSVRAVRDLWPKTI